MLPTPESIPANELFNDPELPVLTVPAATVKLNGHAILGGVRLPQVKLTWPLEAVAVIVQLPVPLLPEPTVIVAALQLPVIPLGQPVVDFTQPVLVWLPVAITMKLAFTVQAAFAAKLASKSNVNGELEEVGCVKVQPAATVNQPVSCKPLVKVSSIVIDPLNAPDPIFLIVISKLTQLPIL